MIKRDAGGDPYSRVDLPDATCPVCGQDVEVSRPTSYLIDPATGKPIHRGCAERLNNLLIKEQNGGVKLND